AGHPRFDPGDRARRHQRHPVDVAQHVRGRGSLRPRAVPVARPDPGGGQAGRAAGPIQGRDARGPVHPPRAAPGRAGMKLRPVAGIVLRQMYLMRTSPARILPMFAWVAIDIVLWGFLTRYLNSVSAARFDFVPMLLGAVLIWDFFQRILHGVTTAF